jgi:hypothetical protein
MKHVALICVVLFVSTLGKGDAQKMNLYDWSLWERYRSTVAHPATTLKAEHFRRARENATRHAWAKEAVKSLEARAQVALKWDDDYLTHMIPAMTPGTGHFTMCPNCEHAPVHGSWRWTPDKPDEIQCNGCKMVFPNEKFPEDLALRSRFDPNQTFSYYGGKSWHFYGFHTRPSFTGYIRAAKVNYAASAVYNLAMAYAATQKPEYAQQARRILLRFAEVYPRYLIHSGYGEYADMDPHVAAKSMKPLPEDELTPPPNKPDRLLHPLSNPFWMAGRATYSGQEGHFLREMAVAYDLTCTAKDAAGKAVYSDEARLKIERDLLLEGTLLAVADPGINNKSGSNRQATAIVGMAVGHPELVRFGMDGFWRVVNEWFLPDGATSESPAYASMMLGGVYELGEALHGYSSPSPQPSPARGEGVEDVYSDARYKQIWMVMAQSLLPTLRYPAIADSYHSSSLSTTFLELMASRYDEPQYRSLLKAMTGDDLSKTDRVYALFHRDPDLPKRDFPPLEFKSQLFPVWRIAFLRTGERGMDATALLSASHWGNHHHYDSLNLTYHRWGEELLGDLGYLWDNPMAMMTRRTLAHNLVVVDEKDQRTTERDGAFRFFKVGEHTQAAEAESQAYPQCSLYRRTVAVVSHDARRHYLVDIFRVKGGSTHDYLFHGPNNDFILSGVILTLNEGKGKNLPVYDLKDVRSGVAAETWQATWKIADGKTLVAWMLPQSNETLLWGKGWGQKGGARVTPDESITLPYLIRRTTGENKLSVFASVFVGEESEPFVRSVKRIPLNVEGVALLRVETAESVDYVLSTLNDSAVTATVDGHRIELNGTLAVVSVREGKVQWKELLEGASLKVDGK